MSNDHPNTSKVEGLNVIRMEESRLEDRRREDNLVDGGAVVGVDGRGGHTPLATIYALTDLQLLHCVV